MLRFLSYLKNVIDFKKDIITLKSHLKQDNVALLRLLQFLSDLKSTIRSMAKYSLK